MFKLDLADCPPESGAEECTGLVFRGYRNFYFDGSKLELKQGIKLLKCKSCPGCSQCWSILETLKEDMYVATPVLPEIEHGALYGAKVVVTSTDWETGYADDWETEIFKIEEP